MKLRANALMVVAIAALTLTVLCQGCTLHFKGENVELSTEADIVFHLEKAELLNGKDSLAKSTDSGRRAESGGWLFKGN